VIIHAAKWDEESFLPLETMKKCAELGFGGLLVREDVGGAALSRYYGTLIAK
jgi:hypothetical protein